MTIRNGFGEGDALVALLPTDPLMARNPRSGETSGTWHTDIINLAGEQVNGSQVVIASNKGLGVLSGYADTLLFDRIWITPNEVNARFITADTSMLILLWNAFLREKKYFTNIAVSNPAGMDIDTIALPYCLQPTATFNFNIDVYKEGPSVQDSAYYLTIGGVVYAIPVRGLRVMSLAKGLNLASQPDISYIYETTIFQSERGKEQRRGVRDLPTRILKGEYLLEGYYGQEFLNKVQYGHDKLFAIPVIDEQLLPTTIATGAKVITLSSTTADKWNLLNLCDFVGIYEPETNQSEIHEISSIGTNSITTINNIAYTYNAKQTIIYPVFFGIIKSVNLTHQTDTIMVVEISYEEKRIAV